MKRIIIIPARYASTRFPGKPLIKLNGKEAILHTVDAARNVGGADGIYVATDDKRIVRTVEDYGCNAPLTSAHWQNGTERVAEAASILGLHDDDIVINLQGGAPLTPPWFVEAIFRVLDERTDAEMVTPALKCTATIYDRMAQDRKSGIVGATTSVLDATRRALYFSKELLPYVSSVEALSATPVYHHVGLYGYRVRSLREFPLWGVGPLEYAEQLEQLRYLENGRAVYVAEVEAGGIEFWELNNPHDVGLIEKAFGGHPPLSFRNLNGPCILNGIAFYSERDCRMVGGVSTEL
jgi:3-deoxy-manno-octulosonate cytidylyltransferase (CMP-KDO synthetase)